MEHSSNSGSSTVGQLSQLFLRTGHAHHEAFLATDGFDPDWAIWYADHTVDQVNALLGTELSRAELIFELVGLSREHPKVAPDTPWSDYYASTLASRSSR